MTRRGLSRRDLLRAGATLAALAALPGCDNVYSTLARNREGPPGPIALARGSAVDPDWHLLNRLTYGPRPSDLAHLRAIGRDAWLEEQLAPNTIGDGACRIRTAQCASARERPADLMSVRERHIDRDLVRDAVIRAAHTKRQLEEVMLGFWRDHLSIDLSKDGCTTTVPFDDHEVLRKHALGRFRDLIRASALSPAMLAYLDGRRNRSGGPDEKPNENYARELLELHTLGVHGGYTQTDVMEVARCLTGWTTTKRWMKGLVVEFQPDAHDDGEKTVLGTRIPAGGGEQDLERLLDVVCKHASTANYLAQKLCRRFVSDAPSPALVSSTAAVFSRTDGSIRDVLRHMVGSAEFGATAGTKVKRPLRFAASAARALDAECRASRNELRFLERTGHTPFHYPTPDGYPDEPEPWMGGLLWRWNFALALVHQALPPSQVDLAALVKRVGGDPRDASPLDLAPLLYGRMPSGDERAIVERYVGGSRRTTDPRWREGVALLLCSPAFQVY